MYLDFPFSLFSPKYSLFIYWQVCISVVLSLSHTLDLPQHVRERLRHRSTSASKYWELSNYPPSHLYNQ